MKACVSEIMQDSLKILTDWISYDLLYTLYKKVNLWRACNLT
jgi:hypothetical protein